MPFDLMPDEFMGAHLGDSDTVLFIGGPLNGEIRHVKLFDDLKTEVPSPCTERYHLLSFSVDTVVYRLHRVRRAVQVPHRTNIIMRFYHVYKVWDWGTLTEAEMKMATTLLDGPAVPNWPRTILLEEKKEEKEKPEKGRPKFGGPPTRKFRKGDE